MQLGHLQCVIGRKLVALLALNGPYSQRNAHSEHRPGAVSWRPDSDHTEMANISISAVDNKSKPRRIEL